MFLRRCSGRVVLASYNVMTVDENNNQLIRIMENPSNPQSEQSNGDRVTEETTGALVEPQPQPEKRVWDALRDGLRRGAEDARTAAEKAIPKVKSAAAGAVYWTAYGAAFAAVFQWTFVKGLSPESLKSGFRDGVKGGTEAAEKWIEKLKRRKEQATDAAPGPTSSQTEAVQPGAA